MRTLKIFFLIAIFFWVKESVAQCPVDEADLADGGTFSGSCSIAVGGNIVITGPIIWNSGVLSITGSNGDIDINGGSLTINGGTVQAVDGNNGDLDVISGSITIASGATLLLDESIQVFNGASITVNGTLSSQDNVIDIDQGGTITVGTTGTIRSSSTGGDQSILVQGTLINDGIVDSDEDIIVSSTGIITNGASGTIQSDDDIQIDGSVTNSGSIDSNDDIILTSTGSLNSSGDISASDELEIDGGAVTLSSGSTLTVDIIIVNTSGTLTSSGEIIVSEDVFVDGGSVTIGSGGTFEVGDDLLIDSGGSFTINTGGSIVIDDDIDVGGPGQGLLIVNGILTANDDLTINNTTPNSSLTGVGVINVGDNYNDSECPGTGTFCSCVGSGVASCASALPVELIAFSAKMEGNSVVLEWQTASELNNDYFTIQRMSSGDYFENILTEHGKGTTQEKSSYRVVDASPAAGKNYYRLMQTDFDGNFSYSDIILVENNSSQLVVTFSPNPLKNQNLALKINNLKPFELARVQIINIHGYQAFDLLIAADGGGTHEMQIPVADWNTGVYIIQIGPWRGKFLVL